MKRLVILLSLAAVPAFAATRYVNLNSSAPAAPYTDWASAATNIQDAIDAALAGDEIVVTNGVYNTGQADFGGATNRVAVTKPLRVRSVNGPAVTTIEGDRNFVFHIRCVALANGAVLSGFTLQSGVAEQGGGVWSESTNAVVTNCTCWGNFSLRGGGAYSGTLNNCALILNEGSFGGGACLSTLNNCTLSGNCAEETFREDYGIGGGAALSVLNGCLLSGNRADNEGGGAFSCLLSHCTIATNTAGGYGGGAYECDLENCRVVGNTASNGGGTAGSSLLRCEVIGNSATSSGGGVEGRGLERIVDCVIAGNTAPWVGGSCYCLLLNCTVVGNSATESTGGVSGDAQTNCIVQFNAAPEYPNYHPATPMFYCSTFPLPTNGVGNITNAPTFVNAIGGNYRLRPGSSCIDAGTDLSALVSSDFNGLPRPLDGNRDGVATFDMGAYEFNPLFFTSIAKVGNNTRLCWFDSPAGMQLQAAASLVSPVWTNVPVVAGTNCMESPAVGNAYFRLIMP